MAGTKIDNFAVGDVNLTAIMDTLQGLRQGHFQASLTEMDTSTIPEIAAGSIFDLNGSLVYVDADESITGSPSDGLVYIKAIYSSGVVSFEWTNTAPEFSSSKNGWYGTGASSGHRYIAKMIKASSAYTGKLLYDSANIPYVYETQKATFYGNWNNGETKTATLTFSSEVKAIINFSYENFGTLIGQITSVSLTSNTVLFSLYSYSTQSNGYYNINCTVAL